MPSARVLAKAERLHREGAVEEVQGRTFTVRGESDTYLVAVTHGVPVTLERARFSCTCPYEGECSHLFAVAALLKVEAAA